MALYLDASVILPLFITDTFSDRAEAAIFTLKQDLVISDWAALEVSSVVSKRNRTGAISSDEASALFVDFDFWRSEVSIAACANADDIAAANTLVRRRDLTLRGPDALHIALA